MDEHHGLAVSAGSGVTGNRLASRFEDGTDAREPLDWHRRGGRLHGSKRFLLWLAQRDIPIGTAYAIWTGIGAAGTFIVGVIFFGDPTSMARFAGVALIIAGVATLKLAH